MPDTVPWESYQYDIREMRARAEAAEAEVEKQKKQAHYWHCRLLREHERVEELEGHEAFHDDPMDPGSYAHTVMLLEARVAELEALERAVQAVDDYWRSGDILPPAGTPWGAVRAALKGKDL